MRLKRFSAVLAAFLVTASSASRASEALTICLNEDAPPYSMHSDSGGSGFDLAVAGALARHLGRTLAVQWFQSKLDAESSGALEANALLSDGHCLLVGGYPLTEDGLGKPAPETARLPGFEGAKPVDRRRRIAMGTLQASKPYHFSPLTVILGGAAAAKPVHSLTDLDGMKIGVEGGTLSDAILMIYGDGRLIDHITHFLPGRGQIWPGLERGDFDATLAPLHRFDAYRAGHSETKLAASGYFHPVGFNLGFAGLARDAALLAEVDAALATMLDSGEIAGLAAPAGMTYLAPRAPDIRKHNLISDLKGP